MTLTKLLNAQVCAAACCRLQKDFVRRFQAVNPGTHKSLNSGHNFLFFSIYVNCLAILRGVWCDRDKHILIETR